MKYILISICFTLSLIHFIVERLLKVVFIILQFIWFLNYKKCYWHIFKRYECIVIYNNYFKIKSWDNWIDAILFKLDKLN